MMKNDLSVLETAQDSTCVTKRHPKFKDILPFLCIFTAVILSYLLYFSKETKHLSLKCIMDFESIYYLA